MSAKCLYGSHFAGLDRFHQRRVVLLGLIAVGLRKIGKSFVESLGFPTVARILAPSPAADP
jgi:hypothetical protein